MKIIFALLFCVALSLASFAQEVKKVDHLTEIEDDLIHDTQDLDKRTAVYIKAIDRRFLVLNGATELQGNKKENKKESELFGALPTGTRAELLGDVKSILAEAVRNIDNAAEHNQKDLTIPKAALKTFGAACARFTGQLQPIYEKSIDETEREAAYDALQICKEVLDAQSRMSATPAN